MSALIESLKSDPRVMAAEARDAKSFFGQGFSFVPERFRQSHLGVEFSLTAYNTPNHTRISWHLMDAGAEPYAYVPGARLLFDLTPEESRGLADSVGLPISAWMEAALESCRRDVTPGSALRLGGVVEPAAFHAGRSGDDR